MPAEEGAGELLPLIWPEMGKLVTLAPPPLVPPVPPPDSMGLRSQPAACAAPLDCAAAGTAGGGGAPGPENRRGGVAVPAVAPPRPSPVPAPAVAPLLGEVWRLGCRGVVWPLGAALRVNRGSGAGAGGFGKAGPGPESVGGLAGVWGALWAGLMCPVTPPWAEAWGGVGGAGWRADGMAPAGVASGISWC